MGDLFTLVVSSLLDDVEKSLQSESAPPPKQKESSEKITLNLNKDKSSRSSSTSSQIIDYEGVWCSPSPHADMGFPPSIEILG